MAGASDKARFYLERQIPELHELQRKKIFTREEVMSIVKKRSDFEHKLNARGSKPIDYHRYLEYEMALDSLKTKRIKRMSSKGVGNHTSQRCMLFIMERATRKFHGDLSLWIQYFQLARRQKAYNKATQILTSMVRLHPTKPEVWTYAAKYTAEEQGDMPNARSYMIRGLRFCKYSRQLYLDYAKLELIYVAKIAARRRILGLDQTQTQDLEDEVDDPNLDVVVLPKLTAEDIDPSLRTDNEADKEALSSLNSTPALTGKIPMTIFDTATAIFNDPQLGWQFFDMVASTPQIPCSSSIARHIADKMSELVPISPYTLDIVIRLPLVGVQPTSPDFPVALGTALKQLKTSIEQNPSIELVTKTVDWVTAYLMADLDQDIRTVLSAVLARTIGQYKNLAAQTGKVSEDEITRILESMRKGDVQALETSFSQWAQEALPSTKDGAQVETNQPAGAVMAH